MFRPADKKFTPFGEILENKRNRWGMNKTELCRRVGMSVCLYNYIIHGKRKCSDKYRDLLIKELELENEIKEAS